MTLLELCDGDRELAALWATLIRRAYVWKFTDESLAMRLAYLNARRQMADRDVKELLAALDRALAGKGGPRAH